MNSLGFAEQLTATLLPEPDLPAHERHAAVALIFRDVQSPQVLMIERSSHPDDPWAGQMAFPGGKAEDGDRNLIATAEREAQEEIGIDLRTQAKFMGGLKPVRARHRGRIMPFSVAPFVYWLSSRIASPDAVKADPLEVAAIHWIPLRHIFDRDNHTDIKYKTEPTILLPAISFSGRKIWGLSYLMLTDLFDRLQKTLWLSQFHPAGDAADWSFWKRYSAHD